MNVNDAYSVPIKYAVGSISLQDTHQTAYDLLAHGGKLAIFLPSAANLKTTKERDIFPVTHTKVPGPT